MSKKTLKNSVLPDNLLQPRIAQAEMDDLDPISHILIKLMLNYSKELKTEVESHSNNSET